VQPAQSYEDKFFEKINKKKRDIYTAWKKLWS
jgi:hypothetical protein